MKPSCTTAQTLAGLAIVFGGLGMALSFLYLARKSMEDIVAGVSGFVAGAVLIGSGVISLAVLATKKDYESSLPARQEFDNFRKTGTGITE